VKLASPITTSIEEVGTPLVQFAAVPQEVLEVPLQLVVCAEDVEKVIITIAIRITVLAKTVFPCKISKYLNISNS
jgi:hypothetical protein